MSERPCNYCEFKSIQQRNPGKEVTVKVSNDEFPGWWRVHIDGVPQGIWYMEIGRRCAC